MYKAAKETKAIRRYMEALALHTGAPTEYWYDNTSFISVVKAKIVTPIVKHFDLPVWLLQENLAIVSLFQNMIILV